MSEETKTDKITTEEATASRLLIREDIAKYELAKANALGQAARCDALIAECKLALADVDRREAGVVYPEPPKAPETAPQNGTEGK